MPYTCLTKGMSRICDDEGLDFILDFVDCDFISSIHRDLDFTNALSSAYS